MREDIAVSIKEIPNHNVDFILGNLNDNEVWLYNFQKFLMMMFTLRCCYLGIELFGLPAL